MDPSVESFCKIHSLFGDHLRSNKFPQIPHSGEILRDLNPGRSKTKIQQENMKDIATTLDSIRRIGKHGGIFSRTFEDVYNIVSWSKQRPETSSTTQKRECTSIESLKKHPRFLYQSDFNSFSPKTKLLSNSYRSNSNLRFSLDTRPLIRPGAHSSRSWCWGDGLRKGDISIVRLWGSYVDLCLVFKEIQT